MWAIILFCFIAFSCSDDSTGGNSLKDVETWIFNFEAGHFNGTQEQFQQYNEKFLTESVWNNLKKNTSQDGIFLNESWFEIESSLIELKFPENEIAAIKAKLASDEKAVFIYYGVIEKYCYLNITKI
jgi:hypothetical protein